MTTNLTRLAAVLTLLGVPTGLALTGGLGPVVLVPSLATVLAAMTLAVRRWPLAVLILSFATVTAWRAAHLIEAGWLWPATAALVALVLAGRLRTAVIASVCMLVYGANWDVFVYPHSGNWVLAHLGGEALWVAATLAGATAYRNTLRWRAEVAHRFDVESHRRRAEERVEIARDLHDVVSHTLAVVGVHLNVALDAFDTEPEEAKASLRLAQEVRGRAMTDLKALVGVLREGELPALEGLDRLLGQVREAGLEVSFNEFLTTFETDEYVFAALAAGASGFLTKEIDPDGLRAAVRVVAGGDALLSPSVTRRVVGQFAHRPVAAAGRAGGERLSVLTGREREVVRLVATGLSNDEIAATLVISPLTAKTHVTRAIAKLSVRDRVQLVIVAYEDGLVGN